MIERRQGEILSNRLAHLDSPLIELALETDTAEKLSRLRKHEKARTRKLVAVAAALALLFAAGLALLPLLRPQETSPDLGTTEPSVTDPALSPASIQTLDLLNYYGGILAIYQPSTASASRAVSAPLSQTTNVDLSQLERFEVESAVYFRFLLESDCPILSELLGEGEAEAVITRNSICDLLTVHRNGRFYSCVITESGVSSDGSWMICSASEYVNGCAIVQDSDAPNVLFRAEFDRSGNAAQVIWQTAEASASMKTVENSTQSNPEGASLPLEEISAYYYSMLVQGLPVGELRLAFVGMNSQQEEQMQLQIYTGGQFCIFDTAYLIDPKNPNAFYLRGENAQVSEGHISLRYLDENGEAHLLEATRGSDGRFRLLDLVFLPKAILPPTENLSTLYFVAMGEDGVPIQYLRADPDGRFLAGEPKYADPYYDGYINHNNPPLEGEWGMENGKSFFVYYHKGKMVRAEGIDHANGDSLTVGDLIFTPCEDPFPPDEVTDVRVSLEGYRLLIARDRHYSLTDQSGKELENGTIRFEQSNTVYVTLHVNTSNGTESLLTVQIPDSSFYHRGQCFFPEEHPAITNTPAKDPGDPALRYDSSNGQQQWTLLITADGTFLLYDRAVGAELMGKGSSAQQDDTLLLWDFGEYNGKTQIAATLGEDENGRYVIFEGVLLRLVYGLC